MVLGAACQGDISRIAHLPGHWLGSRFTKCHDAKANRQDQLEIYKLYDQLYGHIQGENNLSV